MFLDQAVITRLRQKEVDEIDDIVKKDNGGRYDSRSHFLRVAALKLIREEQAKTL